MLDPNYPNWFLNVSLPAGTNMRYKYVDIQANGNVISKPGSNHTTRFRPAAPGQSTTPGKWAQTTEARSPGARLLHCNVAGLHHPVIRNDLLVEHGA